VLVALWLAFAAGRAGAGELDVLGVVSMRAAVVKSRPTWLEGGFGRLSEGGPATETLLRGEVHLGLDWTPTESWLVHAHGVAHGEPSSYRGQQAGLVEAFIQFRPELTPATALRLRAGIFFPPTSLENSDPLWQSPYTISLSLLNSWIGEEVRTTGAEAALQRRGERHRLELAGTAFVVNDTSGTLLAWRGWAMGDRLLTYGETLPLPPVPGLQPDGPFSEQRDDGTRPLDELDSRVGYAARARWSLGDSLRLQGAFTDNRGDRGLHRGQYAWQTRFGQAGLQLRLGSEVTLLAEAAWGDTGMGPPMPGGPEVQLRFRVGYALLSWNRGGFRLSARLDRFDNEDRDTTADPNGESGWGLTTAAFWKPRPFVRVGIEYAAVRGERPAASPNREQDQRAQLEVRLTF
jgi:hypothetical protein